MDNYYELFDLDSGNVIEDYASEEEAIEALMGVVLEHGPQAIATFALTSVKSGQPTLIAMEDALVLRVQNAMTNLVPDPA